MQIKCCSFLNFMFFIFYYVFHFFINDLCFPKVTTPLKERPPKAANSESNEGRYYRNSTVDGRQGPGIELRFLTSSVVYNLQLMRGFSAVVSLFNFIPTFTI